MQAKITKLSSILILRLFLGGPFNSKDEIMIVNPIESFNSILCSFLGREANKAKTATTASVLIKSNIGTDDISKRFEKLKQIRFLVSKGRLPMTT